MISEWSTLSIAIIAAAIFLYGMSKTAMPVAGVVAGPVLAAVLTPGVASAFAIPLLLVGDIYALALYRSHVNWPLILRLIPGVLAGLLLTAFLFTILSPATLSRMLGVLILISVLLEVVRMRQNSDSEKAEDNSRVRVVKAGFFGVLAGMTSMAANAGGTAMSLYLINMRVSTITFMGTSAWFFLFVNLTKVPLLINLDLLTTQTLLSGAWFVPVVIAGAAVGSVIFRHLPKIWFYRIALVLSSLAALWLLIHG